MPTVEQIRAARALLGWSQGDLAEKADLSQTGIARIENGTNKPNSQTLEKIENAFDEANIELINHTGVKIKDNSFKIYRGSEGLKYFMDDVYMTLNSEGGEFCIFNADAGNWMKWMGAEYCEIHKQRMLRIKDKIQGKIIVNDKDDNFIGSDYAEYRWFQGNDYDEKKTLYSYCNKLAFLDFREESVTITVMDRFEFSNGFRVIFNCAWDQAAIPEKVKKRA